MVPTTKVHGISMNNPVCPTYASDRDSDGLFVNARLGSKMGSLSLTARFHASAKLLLGLLGNVTCYMYDK